MILQYMLKKHLFHRALKDSTSEYNLAATPPPRHSNSQADNYCVRQQPRDSPQTEHAGVELLSGCQRGNNTDVLG